MSKMNDTKLGQLITGQPLRDAIHIAIAPVIAGEDLKPGEHLGLTKNGEAIRLSSRPIGIADPFLQHDVKKGDRFWLCLYQQTITGMRHSWVHPSFPEITGDTSAASELWLRNFAASAAGIGMDYHELMDAAGRYLENGDMYCFSDTIDYTADDFDAFWSHYRNVTGRTGSGEFFRCAC